MRTVSDPRAAGRTRLRIDRRAAPDAARNGLQRLVVAVVVAALATAFATTGVASAAPWTTTYDWQGNAQTGYENWVVEESVPVSGAPGPFYSVWQGTAPPAVGRGIAIRPIGGRVYASAGPTEQLGGPGTIVRWGVPGASRITRATFDDLRYRNEADDQYLRVRVVGAPGTATETADFGPAFNEPSPTTTYDPAAVTRNVAAGVTAEAWLFTVCSRVTPGEPPVTCPNVPTSTGTFGRVGSTTFTLNDPDKPTVEVATSPDITDGWVNRKRAQRLTVTASDPSSGIERIRIQATNGTSGGTAILNQQVTCDPLHRTPGRGGLNCPPTTSATKTDPAGAQGAKGRTYTVTAIDDAGNVSDPVIRRIRYDTDDPRTASISGPLKGLLNEWTNRRGTVPVTVRATDALSGVARVELLAQRVAGGRAVSLGAATTACTGECRSVAQALDANLDAITRDGRYRLQVRATDRAGNRSKAINVPGQLKIDRTAPKKTGRDPFYVSLGNGRIRVFVPVGRDNPDGAGIGNYIVRFFEKSEPFGGDGAATPRVVRVRAGRTESVRIKRQRFRTIELSGVDTLRSVEGPETACDAARFGAPRTDLDDEMGNCPDVVVLARSTTTKNRTEVEQEYIDQGLASLEQFANSRAGRASNAARPIFRLLSSRLARIIVKGSGIIGSVWAFVTAEGDVGCETGRLSNTEDLRREVRAAGRAVKRITSRVERARPGRNVALRRELARVRALVKRIPAAADRLKNTRIERCQVPMETAAAGAEQMEPGLQRAFDRLHGLIPPDERDEKGRRIVKQDDSFLTTAIGSGHTCRRPLKPWKEKGKSLREGRNHVVYWLQRPKDNYIYVGISSSFVSRCEAHARKGPVYEYAKANNLDPKRLAQGITVFASLPPQSYVGARQVEQTLMERYGFSRKPDRRGALGTLVNRNHSYDPSRPEYCPATFAGRGTLRLYGYADQAKQEFAFSKDCEGNVR